MLGLSSSSNTKFYVNEILFQVVEGSFTLEGFSLFLKRSSIIGRLSSMSFKGLSVGYCKSNHIMLEPYGHKLCYEPIPCSLAIV
jgi:hypothetical protein